MTQPAPQIKLQPLEQPVVQPVAQPVKQSVPVPPMTQAQKLAQTARTNKIRLIVDAIMILCALFLILTSIVKMPFPIAWYDFLAEKGVFEKFSFTFLAYLHDTAGILFLVGLVVHLVLNWKRLTWLIKAALK